MMNAQLGGLLIMTLGVLLFAVSMPVLRLTIRHHQPATPQFSDSMISWLLRIFAAIVVMLGLVTLLQR